ncbi:MAG: thioesterase, partial [Candidatus Gastranaerophilales bacterium]|nr:thioesterase [Candidatus Gastranaerophilales bacterium]
MFNELYKIKYFEKDTSNRLKFNVLLDFMADVATKNADFCHIGYKDIVNKNYAWFLLKYTFEFYNYPENLTEINISTQSRGANKLFAYRDFLISDNENNTLGKVFSIWGLINLADKKMLNLHDVFGNYISDFQKDENDLIFQKIPQINNINYSREFNALYYDIDINHHVNNTCLVRWAL